MQSLDNEVINRIEPQVLTVSQLNRQVREWFEQTSGEICVEGEISNLSRPSSGHYYFTLKDTAAQIRCVYFRNRHKVLDKALQNGQHVLTRGHLSLYESRGDFQLIVEQLTGAGFGHLYQQFEQLKIKLGHLGLFEHARKKAIPRFPEAIGIVTSTNAAALRDILTTLARRYPLAEVYIYPSDVQGKQASLQLIKAIQKANQEARCQVILLARGGGSIEDLWAFNDETLAYAIAESLIPIVTGIGHETDFTIADFVADLRAPTPTAAAEAVTPEQTDLKTLLQTLERRLIKAIQHAFQQKKWLLNFLLQQMTSPGRLIASHTQTLDYLERHLVSALKQSFDKHQMRMELLGRMLAAQNPRILLEKANLVLQQWEGHLKQSMGVKIQQLRQHLSVQMKTLHTVSPLATLDRGYALVMMETDDSKKVITESTQVAVGDRIEVRLARGRLWCEVEGRDLEEGE